MVFRSGREIKRFDADALWSFALRTLGRRALSRAELRERLRPRALLESDVDGVLDKLAAYGAIDDKAFAEGFAAARLQNQGLGKMRVLRDLRQRRVGRTTAEDAVRGTFEGTDEVELALQFLQRKFRNTDLKKHFADRRKLDSAYRRLRYAGFSSAASVKALKQFSASADALEDSEPEPGE